jgi:hypothetical protein
MTLPRTVAEVLAEHVVFEVECIDRMYLNVSSTASSLIAQAEQLLPRAVHDARDQELTWTQIGEFLTSTTAVTAGTPLPEQAMINLARITGIMPIRDRGRGREPLSRHDGQRRPGRRHHGPHARPSA